MELTAVIKGLQAIKEPCTVTVHSDSEYVCNGINKGWAKSWQSRGWKKKDNKPALNPDLWKLLLSLCDFHNVTFVWQPGHSGEYYNERCNTLSQEMCEYYMERT